MVRKLLQNKIAESKLSLPVMVLYAVAVWLLAGLIDSQWWLQFGCFILATYLMAELNNINALIRVYSRMVSCVFILLSCAACFLFPNLRGAVLEVCFIATQILLFMTYQNKESMGLSYYAYVLFGIATMTNVHLFYYLPLLWLLTATQLQSLSWRTWGASLLGIITPYWIGACWLVWQEDFTPLIEHFTQLADISTRMGLDGLTIGQTAVVCLTLLFALTGMIHYIRKSHDDKIRIRLIYAFFAWIDLATALFLVLQPQHYDMLMRILIVNTAPLAAHFVALTSTRLTNIYFCLLLAAALAVTGYNLWTASFLF